MPTLFETTFHSYTLSLRKSEKRGYFVHIPKTAGSSIVRFCRSRNIEVVGHNIRNQSFTWFKDYPDRSNYFSFAFVREPISRVISAFSYLSKGGYGSVDSLDSQKYILDYKLDLEAFVQNEIVKGDVLNQTHFLPQYRWILDDDGKVCVDFVGRFEHLHSDFKKLDKFLGCREFKLDQVNRTSYKTLKTILSKGSEDIIKDVYAADYELFNYSK